MRRKIALVGGGQIGQTLAMLALMKELGEVVLLDTPSLENPVKGKALDLMEMAPQGNCDATVIGTSDPKDIEGADVVIVTAGRPRDTGMTQKDLLEVNSAVINGVAGNVRRYAPNAFCIIITNPLDAMVHLFYKVCGFARQKVVGMAGTLDVARWRAFIAMELGVSAADVAATVLGGHGPDMLPLPRLTTVGGVPLTEIATKEQIDRLIERTRGAGAEIMKLLGRGSAFFSPAWSAIAIAESYLEDKRRVLACMALCEGEYGVHGLFIGVPALISFKGVEKIYEIKLTEDEKAALTGIVARVKKAVAGSGL
jgi:malate dehydrogenase